MFVKINPFLSLQWSTMLRGLICITLLYLSPGVYLPLLNIIYSRSSTSGARQRGFHNQLDIRLDAAMTFLHQGRMVALAVWALLLSCGVSTATEQVINQQL